MEFSKEQKERASAPRNIINVDFDSETENGFEDRVLSEATLAKLESSLSSEMLKAQAIVSDEFSRASTTPENQRRVLSKAAIAELELAFRRNLPKARGNESNEASGSPEEQK